MKWGQWGSNLSIDEVSTLIKDIYDLGITAFDHADIYGDYEEEDRFGLAFPKTGIDRKDIQLITKYGIRMISEKYPQDYIKHYNATKEHMIASAEVSLKKLGTDYLDVFLFHRPSPLMNPEEIAEGVEQLKSSGKILEFGVSNFTPSQFDLLNSYTPLYTNQVEASIAHLDPFTDGTFDQALKYKYRPMIWSPMAGGQVFGEQKSENIIRIISEINELSLTTGHPFDQLLLAFLMHHPAGLIPVLGTTKAIRYKSALEAVDIKLTDMEWFEIWSAAIGGEVA
ncbi:UNVERIFIED_CONTAM: hypothetical protein GTU68_004235 [Idotea baltica]|nr:hypothetical protein [Idotea baltica]